MSSLENLRALNNQIIFVFTEDTTGNAFHTKTKFGIEIVEDRSRQMNKARWGKVVKVGKNVSSDITPGLYVLVEALQWTTHHMFEGEKFWVTTEEKCLVASEDYVSEF